MSGNAGGSSKRLHEEAAHGHLPSASKYPPHEDANSCTGVGPSISFPILPTTKLLSHSNEYHAGAATFDLSFDARMTKIPRAEPRDADKQSSALIQVHRATSLSSGDLHSDHLMATENKVDSKDSLKDVNRDLRMVDGIRDVKAESKEFHNEAKRYSADKGERDAGRFESIRAMGESNKEAKHDREVHTAPSKCDNNVGSHLNWKDAKEYNRGKKYICSNPGSGLGSSDPWLISQPAFYRQVEVGKGAATTEEREYVESHGREAVGESKVGLKGDDKLKDKDRKRKEPKHRDWGEREKDKGDRRVNLHIGSSGSECRDLMREEREAERWEREKKDPFKERERPKEREKDHVHVKREVWNGAEIDSLPHREKEAADDFSRKPEHHELLGIEQKKQDLESWKNADREVGDRRKERDADDGEKLERRNKIYEKESDDGCIDVDGGSERERERERELFNHGFHQRKRMLRSRGSPQVANCFVPHTQDTERFQGKPEISTVVYKVGECMQELIKLWREHKSSLSEKNMERSHIGPTLEIRIPAEHVTATNRQVRGGQLWGTDIYTDDSDLVAVLMHTGYCRPTASSPPSSIHELHVTIQVLPPQDCYVSTLRNNVRSRAWGAAIGCSYHIERCCIVKKGGGTIELEPCLSHMSTVEPTLAPVAVERTMTTRAAASNALRQQKFVREVTIQYNLCNEPWIKYSISMVADKGLKKPLYTSARLKKGEVLYLETHSRRYELCFSGEKIVKGGSAGQMHEGDMMVQSSNGDGDNVAMDVYRWSRCKKALPQKVMRSIGVPLPVPCLEVLEENLDWEDVQWSQSGVWIGGMEYVLARLHFLSPH